MNTKLIGAVFTPRQGRLQGTILGAWFATDNAGYFMSVEDYENTWDSQWTASKWQPAMSELTDKQLLESFETRLFSKSYHEYVSKMETMELEELAS